VRHGQSTWNHEHRIQGQLDPPLSDQGRRQAVRLGRRLAGRKFAGLYTSDLKRAYETSTLLGEAVGVEPTPMAELREIHLGEWEGLTTDELAVRFPQAWSSWRQEPDWDLVAGGEGSAAFEARVGSTLDAIFARHHDGDMLVVTHGGVIQIALHRIERVGVCAGEAQRSNRGQRRERCRTPRGCISRRRDRLTGDAVVSSGGTQHILTILQIG
jgi:broad specificity phosphatase PhoE